MKILFSYLIAFIMLNIPLICFGQESNTNSKCRASFENPENRNIQLETKLSIQIKYLKKLIDPKILRQIKINKSKETNPENTNKNYSVRLTTKAFSKENTEFFKSAIINEPEIINAKFGNTNKNLLHLAIIYNNLEIVKFLSQFKTLINQKDNMGTSPLLLSITTSKADILDSLISLPDIDVKAVDMFEDNIFHHVFLSAGTTNNRIDILSTLFKNLDPELAFVLINSLNYKGESSFSYLLRDFDKTIIDFILDHSIINFSQTTKEGNNLLHLAVLALSKEAIIFLIKKDPFLIHKKNHLGLTPYEMDSTAPSYLRGLIKQDPTKKLKKEFIKEYPIKKPTEKFVKQDPDKKPKIGFRMLQEAGAL